MVTGQEEEMGVNLEDKKQLLMDKFSTMEGRYKQIEKFCMTNFAPLEQDDFSLYRGEQNSQGEKEGRGIKEWPNGDKYVGNWERDQAQGYGCFMYANGELYEGEWHGGKAHGVGKFLHRDGSVYLGEW
mmetsp:Transcript_39443/g.29135  ORF Transcript_39443/g.29135 Transcript_39443/m.29135 type:complete len:128 (+) Transcript_39443:261-644(+)